MASQDDIQPRRFSFSENVDYLDSAPNVYLNDNLNLISCIQHISSQSSSSDNNARLHNACWRRMSINLHKLPQTNPFVINWDKNSDLTWLYGPKLAARLPEPATPVPAQPAPAMEQPATQSDDGLVSGAASLSDSASFSDLDLDDSSSISSIDSGYEPDYTHKKMTPPLRKSFYYGADADDQDYDCQFLNLKPILKSPRKLWRRHRRSKRVSFNHIINSREFINGISFDYDFLDQACL